MVLEGDVAAGARVDEGIADLGSGAPAADGAVLDALVVEGAFEDFDAVDPMFDMGATDDEARLIPFADGIRSLPAGGDHGIEGAGLAVGAAFGVGVAFVIEELEFEADAVDFGADAGGESGAVGEAAGEFAAEHAFEAIGAGLAGGVIDEDGALDAVLEAGIAAFGEAPVEEEFEIGELIESEQVLGDAGFEDGAQRAVLDHPGVAGGVLFSGIEPTVHGAPVEEQAEAGGLFLGGEGVVGGGKRGRKGEEESEMAHHLSIMRMWGLNSSTDWSFSRRGAILRRTRHGRRSGCGRRGVSGSFCRR